MEIKWDQNMTAERLKAKAKESIAAVALQALKDANALCKEDTGVLIDTSLIGTILPKVTTRALTENEQEILDSAPGSDVQNGTLVWATPYAKRQYYTGQPSPDKNPNATTMWAHKGYAAHRAEYEQIARKAAGVDDK